MVSGKYLPIINRGDSCKLKVSDINYIIRDNRKLIFVTYFGERETYEKMEEIEKYLGQEFFRCMSGCIVNMEKIRELKDSSIYFEDGEKLGVGRDTYIRIKQHFNAYLRHLLPYE